MFAVVARRKGGQQDYVMQSFQNYIDRLGLVKAELKCDQEPSTLDVANALVKQCQSTILKCSKGSLGRGEGANLTIQGQLRAFREAVSMKYMTKVGPCVDGLDGSTLCMGCKSFPSERNRENALSFYSGQGLHWRSCAIWSSVLGAKSLRRWSQVEHGWDARSFRRQA